MDSEEATKDEKSIIKEYEIHNEEFEEAEENYESSDEDNENVSEYSATLSKEDNYEKNIFENNDNNNDEDYTSQDNMSEGTTEDTNVQDEDSKEAKSTDLRRRLTRATRQIEQLNPQWRGKICHQIEREHIRSNKHNNNINKEVERTKQSREEVARELEYSHSIMCQSTTKKNGRTIEYSHKQGLLIARFMNDFQERVTIAGYSYAQQFLLKKGLKVFEDRGNQALRKELDQLYRWDCFTPVSIGDMTVEERRKAQIALMFLTEKRDRSVKGRILYNGEPTRERICKSYSSH